MNKVQQSVQSLVIINFKNLKNKFYCDCTSINNCYCINQNTINILKRQKISKNKSEIHYKKLFNQWKLE